MKKKIEKNCTNCSHMYYKQDAFWDNEYCCICGLTDEYIGYPDDAEKECCKEWKE